MLGIGHADRSAFDHTRAQRNHVFQFIGEDVEAADDDHVFLAVDDFGVTPLVHDADIAGAHVSIRGEGFGIFFRLVVVAHHDIGAFDANFA